MTIMLVPLSSKTTISTAYTKYTRMIISLNFPYFTCKVTVQGGTNSKADRTEQYQKKKKLDIVV
jgi:hypothetical protein